MKNIIWIIVICLFAVSCKEDTIIGELKGKPSVDFSTDKESYLIGETVFLTNLSKPTESNIIKYHWHFGFEGVGSYSNEENPAVKYSRAGEYEIKLTVTTESGAYTTISKKVKIQPLNQPPKVDFSYLPQPIVIKKDVQFTDLSIDEDGKIESWLWNFGNDKTSTEQNPVTQYEKEGLYIVKLTVKDDRGDSSFKQMIVRVVEKAPADEFKILWEVVYETGSQLRSVSPAVSDNGDVYITSNASILYAYSPSGTMKWKFDMTKDGASGNQESSPMIDREGNIYCGVGYGANKSNSYLYSINKDGAQNWKLPLGAGARIAYTAPALSYDGNILIGNRGSGGSLKKVNKVNGAIMWSVAPSGGVGGCLASLNNGFAISGSTGTKGFALVNDYGKVQTYLGATSAVNGSCIAIDDIGNIYLAMQRSEGSADGIIYCYSASGEKLWEYVTKNKIDQGGIAIGENGVLYVGTKGTPGELIAISKSGSKLWSYENNSPISSVPAIDNKGNIHFCDDGGNYVILNNDGSLKYSNKLGTKAWSSPTISDYGVIYVAVEDGANCKLVAIDMGVQGPANSPWAQRGQNARKSFLQK